MTSFTFPDRSLPVTVLFVLFSAACATEKGKDPADQPIAETLFHYLDSTMTGITFINVLEETEDWNILHYEYLFNGGGVGAGDVNNDGLPDLYFVSNTGQDRLYINEGDLRFEDVTHEAGITSTGGYRTGVTMADINGDSFLDIHVCRSAKKDPELRRNLVYMNNGDGTFTERSKEMGLDDPSYSTQAYFFDMDLDGDLDLYLLNHPGDMIEANNIKVKQTPAGALEVILSEDLSYSTDRLYRNDGPRFTDISNSAGIRNEAFGLSAVVADFNQDGKPDILVCNDYVKPDLLYIAQEDGTYQNEYDRYFAHAAFSTMGSDMADINNDGSNDVMTVDMTARDHYRYHTLGMATNMDKYEKMIKVGLGAQFSGNTLQLNNGNGAFSDICHLTGMTYTDWSWSPLLMDLDNDGWKDAWISNGYVRDVTNNDYMRYRMDSLQKELNAKRITLTQWLSAIPSVKVRSFLFRNEHDLTFIDRSEEWNSGPPGFSNGSAYVDLDNDGYLDIVTNNINDAPFVLRNRGAALIGNDWVRFRLDADMGTSAIGTSVEIRMDDGTVQTQYIQPGRGFMSCSETVAHFGLGKGSNIREVEIKWPDGSRQLLSGPARNQVHVVNKASGATLPPGTTHTVPPIFVDRSAALPVDMRHVENEYNDFKREPLLYHRLSISGPAVAVSDINGDGTEDVFLGGAMGQAAKLFVQDREGGFIERSNEAFATDKDHEDVCAVFIDVDMDGDPDLFVGSGGNERPRNDPAYMDRIYLNDGTGRFTRSTTALPNATNSAGCVAASDVDGDGDMDLFVGSRSIPGKFPNKPPSQLLRNDGGRFTDVTMEWSDGLQFVGMVTDARFADLDKDGKAELVVVGEWLPITVFRMTNGRFTDATQAMGLDGTEGWWCSLDIADLDGDGYPEILAGNLGRNTALTASKEKPTKLVYKDFDRNGTIDPILCGHIDGKDRPLQLRDRVLDQMIMLKKRFLRYETYALATLDDLFTKEEMDGASTLEARTFSHTLFMNDDGARFMALELPNMAQLSMAQAMRFVDADGDGDMDVLVAGNMYGSDIQFGRYDASIGTFMKGDGKGGLKVVPNRDCGLLIGGPVRHVVPLRIQGRDHLLIVRNNDRCGLVGLEATSDM
ncbi:MAG: VCBS repeat-containing protein [Flavobacteriales bacterium]|nr:VCBS repeat-containing protein [Flavobacteriales bacterium]